MLIIYPNTVIFIVEKKSEKLLQCDSHIFATKNITIFVILTLGVLSPTYVVSEG